MRVHIISDMEGISGIVNPHQTNAGKEMFDEGRQLYTEEINAAVRGAKAGGATEIVVMDCHGAGDGFSWNSLIAEDLDPGCEYVVQDEWTGYTAFLESGCDAALFVGMHAMAGTSDGVLNHTVSGVDWQNLWFNGTRVGETGINAALCGTWGCPVLLVTGDRAVGREAKALLGVGLEAILLRGALMSESYLELRLGELLDSVTERAGPGAGAVAAVSAASAAALVELAARATDLEQWPEAAGAAAQARRLRERLVPLAREDAEAYQAAVAQLNEHDDDFALGEALARAADIPLEIADHAENVSALAAEAAARANPDLRADAAAAAALALGAAWAAAKLVEVNLAMHS